MGYKKDNNADIITNVKIQKIDRTNPCQNSILNSSPYEYWQFEETNGTNFKGLYGIADFTLYNSNTYNFNANVDGIANTSGIEAGKYPSSTGNTNFFITNLDNFKNNIPTTFTIELWIKPTDLMNDVLFFGNDLTIFGFNNPSSLPAGKISQFNSYLKLVETTDINNNTVYKWEFNFSIWNNVDWILNNTVYDLGSPTYTITQQSATVELQRYYHVIISYDNSSGNGTVNLNIDNTVIENVNTDITLPSNTQPLMICFGKSVSDTNTAENYFYDEIVFYQRLLSNQEIDDHYTKCLTLPSISGWNPIDSSNHYEFNTDTNYNDYATLYDTNLWNNARGYKQNSFGRLMFEIILSQLNTTNLNDIGLGISDQSSSLYGMMGNNVPCADNSIMLFYDQTSATYTLKYALDKNYGSLNITGKNSSYKDNATISIGVDFVTKNIEYYVDSEFIYSFNWGQYLGNTNFYPSLTSKTTSYGVQLRDIGPFYNQIDSYADWGAISTIPTIPQDTNDYSWNQSYQNLILADSPYNYWRFQESTGLQAIDEINGDNLTHTFGVFLARSGVEGFGVLYPTTINSDTYINPYIPLNHWYNSSIEFWFKYNGDLTKEGTIYDLRSTDNSWYLQLNKKYDSLTSTAYVAVEIYTEDASGNVIFDYSVRLTNLNLNSWNHIVFTFSVDELFRTYLNGAKNIEICGVEWANKASNYAMTINYQNSNDMSFYFDELAFYTDILSDYQIKKHYIVGSKIITQTENNNLIFVGIPNIIGATKENIYIEKCKGYVDEYGYDSVNGTWGLLNSIEPSNIALASNTIRQLSCGYDEILILDTNGYTEALGNSSAITNVPNSITSVDIQMVSTGENHAAALLSDNTVSIWGDNSWNQLDIPVNLVNVVQIACGDNHTVALKSDGTVVCWGKNDLGQCDVPTSLVNVVQITAGMGFSVALKADGSVVVWGDNTWSQLNIPSSVVNIIQISSQGTASHIVALKSDGTVVCWGANYDNQSTVPTNLSGIVAISSGTNSSYAIKSDGSLIGWGNIYRSNGATYDVSQIVNVININTCPLISSGPIIPPPSPS